MVGVGVGVGVLVGLVVGLVVAEGLGVGASSEPTPVLLTSPKTSG